MQSGFTKGGQQDKARLAKLLEIAKGQHRTMKQFAEECGVNPSTFSRISNEKMAGSSSEAVIRAIYEHRAPGSRISLMDLMQANGMVPSVHSSYSEYRYQSQLAKEIIMKEMTRRVEATGYLEKRLRLTKTMGYTPDMICENEQFGGNGLWAFDYMPCFNDNSQFGDKVTEDVAVRRRKMMNKRRIFERMSRYATMYYFHPEIVPQRFTFIVANKDLFADVIDEYGEQKFKTDVSLVLVDLDADIVVDEYIFQRSDGTMMNKFFSIKVEDNETEKDEELFDIDKIHEDEAGQTFLF